GAAGVRDRGGHAAVPDELHPGPGLADLLLQRLVPGPYEHALRHLAHRLLDRLGHQHDVLLDAQVLVYVLRRIVTHHHLLHVDHGRGVVHAPLLSDREDGQGVVVPERGEAGAVDRVHRDVDVGAVAVAHGLAVEQHRGLVLPALADHDGAVHAHGVHEGAPRVDRGAGGPGLGAG